MKMYTVSKNYYQVRRRFKFVKKLFSSLFTLLTILVLIWFLVSYIQIINHNCDQLTNTIQFTYPDWNIFVWFGNHFNG